MQLGPQFDSPIYRAWHSEHVDGPVRASQRAAQVQAARDELGRARRAREAGEPATARRALRSAAAERRIAAQMPRM